MSFWRPLDSDCIYVISDIFGKSKELKLILNRVLPLRNTGGVKDRLIFLGNYIDRGSNSPEVIDLVIKAKEMQPDQVTCLIGNHELMLLNALKASESSENYLKWMKDGGLETLSRYIDRLKIKTDPWQVNRKDLRRFIPKNHIDFISNLEHYHELNEIIFVHAGCDPLIAMEQQSLDTFVNDSSVFKFVKRISDKSIRCNWDKLVITGHNSEKSGLPFMYDKFYMLDGSSADRINVLEVNSLEVFSARKNNKRLVKESVR